MCMCPMRIREQRAEFVEGHGINLLDFNHTQPCNKVQPTGNSCANIELIYLQWLFHPWSHVFLLHYLLRFETLGPGHVDNEAGNCNCLAALP